MKICSKCNKEKTLGEFNKRKAAKDGLLSNCKECQTEYTRRHYSSNKDYYKLKANRWRSENGRHSYVYNLTDEQYAILCARYNGKCWICKTNDGKHIDHDHSCCSEQGSCGKCVRGILCSGCNTGLGLFKDDSKRLANAIEYLAFVYPLATNQLKG